MATRWFLKMSLTLQLILTRELLLMMYIRGLARMRSLVVFPEPKPAKLSS